MDQTSLQLTEIHLIHRDMAFKAYATVPGLCLAFMWMLKTEFRSSCLCGKQSSNQATSPASGGLLFKDKVSLYSPVCSQIVISLPCAVLRCQAGDTTGS